MICKKVNRKNRLSFHFGQFSFRYFGQKEKIYAVKMMMKIYLFCGFFLIIFFRIKQEHRHSRVKNLSDERNQFTKKLDKFSDKMCRKVSETKLVKIILKNANEVFIVFIWYVIVKQKNQKLLRGN